MGSAAAEKHARAYAGADDRPRRGLLRSLRQRALDGAPEQNPALGEGHKNHRALLAAATRDGPRRRRSQAEGFNAAAVAGSAAAAASPLVGCPEPKDWRRGDDGRAKRAQAAPELEGCWPATRLGQAVACRHPAGPIGWSPAAAAGRSHRRGHPPGDAADPAGSHSAAGSPASFGRPFRVPTTSSSLRPGSDSEETAASRQKQNLQC